MEKQPPSEIQTYTGTWRYIHSVRHRHTPVRLLHKKVKPFCRGNNNSPAGGIGRATLRPSLGGERAREWGALGRVEVGAGPSAETGRGSAPSSLLLGYLGRPLHSAALGSPLRRLPTGSVSGPRSPRSALLGAARSPGSRPSGLGAGKRAGLRPGLGVRRWRRRGGSGNL